MMKHCTRFLEFTFLVLMTLVLPTSCQQEKNIVIQPLNNGWMLHLNQQQIIEAEVPGLVHTDLFKAGLIPDPFYGFNEDSLQWVGNRQWLYSLDFKVDNQLLKYRQIHLIFDGLDTYAQVYLNGKALLWADNMFRQWELDVKESLHKGTNRLEIRFFPPDSISQTKAQSHDVRLPEHRAFSRKAPFQAGWDWGPVFHTMGIWKTVQLIAWNDIRLHEAAILTRKADSLSADMELFADIESNLKGLAMVRLAVNDKVLIEKKVQLTSGKNEIRLPFNLSNPQLWWPNGSGKQPLTRFELEIKSPSGEVHTKALTTGIRQVELVRELDSIGESFLFRINGQEIFAKGANYIPEDHFVTRISREKTRKLLIDAAAVGMNMVRVWGGGIYPSEDFYDLCDSLGLMVWQDFMFACTMYPWDRAFMENVEAEVGYQIKRLRGHPSLVLWCGNNEVLEGFHNWGWQRSLKWSAIDSNQVWNGYIALFEQLIPELVVKHDPYTPYWPSSPSLGWGRAESLNRGDVHYWGVWWGEEPFEFYRQKVGRFNSEYGFQAMPAIESVRQYLPQDQHYIGSAGLEAHQKHPRGTRLIHDYMARDFPLPQSLDDYIYTSQLTQMYGIGMAIEAHRRNKPITMGTLYWQLNDSWPVTSWSSVDYFGRWKALHYRLKELYAPVMISFEENHGSLAIYGISDLKQMISGTLQISFISSSGETLSSREIPATIRPGHSMILAVVHPGDFPASVQAEEVLLRARLLKGTNLVAENLHIPVKPKALRLNNQPIMLDKQVNNHSIILSISSEAFHYAVQLQSNDTEGKFSDNYFHLYPGELKKLKFEPSGKISPENLVFSWRSLNSLLTP